ncbi:uncharacterized protein LOC106139738 isoform X2 [Amyelois transitella]|nr:uncharacterized protein LOC106139738 isoform X2 [Amyelois transitella]
MTRRKSVCLKWTLVLLVVIFCPSVCPRPQDSSPSLIGSTTINIDKDKPTENPIRELSTRNQDGQEKAEQKQPIPAENQAENQNSGREVKNKAPIRESIKFVANQLLQKSSNNTDEASIVIDTRIPPKIKNQVTNKHSIKTRNDDGDEPMENGHAGIAVPVTMEDLEKENKISESSTSNEGISTWVLLSNPTNFTGSTEPTKVESSTKKQKPTTPKNKLKRPQNKNPIIKRPIIGSTNKSDLVAGGSAINENVYNKIKDTVLSNVQKNKVSTTQRTTTVSSTSPPTTTEVLTTKKEVTKVVSTSTLSPVVKITSKPSKKKNKNKHKTTSTTLAPVENESALLPMEPKEQEIELEISTPATTTKKPKRSSTRKKNKTKKRKTSKKPETEASVSDNKTSSNKTKSAKPAKKPTSITGPFTTQIYNYLSREVMPVGVGVIGLASLVGLASYFLYPFSTPVRRNFEVDKKDNLYKNNAEEYAIEGNGQAEEDMLGTVLAGMPAHAKQKINPYAGQTVAHGNTRYTVKKEQDIRYRHVAANREPNYNLHYPQQKTGIAHGAVYSKPVNYNPLQYETRNIYTTESKYTYDKGASAYTPYPAVEPIYAAPQTGPSAGSSYGSDASNSVVYGVKPNSDTDFRPVYPFEGHIYSETTSNPATYSPTSMYLGSNDDSDDTENSKYEENESNGEEVDNKFVVGNVPKELSDSATPAVVPEHGPRKLRRRRHAINKRSVRGNIEEILNDAKNRKDIFISNEIDDSFGYVKHISSLTNEVSANNEMTVQPESKDFYTIYAEPANPSVDQKTTSTDVPSTFKNDVVESVSTVPINNYQEKSTTEATMTNVQDVTTKAFKVYEVFSTKTDEQSSPIVKDITAPQETTSVKNMMTETTTELKSETTSTMPPSVSAVSEQNPPKSTTNFIDTSDVVTYPPPNSENGFFSLLKRFLEFKYRLGLSILQTTSDNLKRYLEGTVHNVAKAS